jgi:hypothetical protein
MAAAAVGSAPIGAFNAAATEPSDADVLEAPREQLQPVDGPLEGSPLVEPPGKATHKQGLTDAPLQQPVDASAS